MSTYTKTNWVNNSPPAIDATNLNKIEQGIADAHSELATHEAATTAHGSTSAATPNSIMQRDASGRAKVAPPSASDDIARKDTVDAILDPTTGHKHTGTAGDGPKLPLAAVNEAIKGLDANGRPFAIVSVKEFGAKGDGVTDDTAPIHSAIVEAYQRGTILFFPPGTYKTTGLRIDQQLLGTGVFTQFEMLGVPYRSVIYNTDTAGKHALEITGLSSHKLSIVGLVFRGSGPASGGGNGLYIHNMNFDVFNLWIERCVFEENGGHGLYLPEQFTTTILNCEASSNGGHAFYLKGGNTTTLIGCYAHVISPGKVGYRLLKGGTLISCNGIDSNTNGTWGEFGATLAEDGFNSGHTTVMIRCNVEFYNAIGVRGKYVNYLSLISTVFLANNPGGFQYHMKLEDNIQGLVIDPSTNFEVSGSGSPNPAHIFLGGTDGARIWCAKTLQVEIPGGYVYNLPALAINRRPEFLQFAPEIPNVLLPKVHQFVLEKKTAEPTAVEGMIAFADGVGWNPGGGKGLYFYDGTAWIKL